MIGHVGRGRSGSGHAAGRHGIEPTQRHGQRSMRLATIGLLAITASPALAQTNPLTVNPFPVILCGTPGQAISNVPVTISSSSAPVTFYASTFTSDGNWLATDPTFSTITTEPRTQLTAGINGGFIPFAPGSYNGQIVLTTFDGIRLTTIPVTLVVSAAGCGATKTGSLFVDNGPLTFQLPPNANAGE